MNLNNVPHGRSPDDHTNFLEANEYAEFKEFLQDHYDIDFNDCMNQFEQWQEAGCPTIFTNDTLIH